MKINELKNRLRTLFLFRNWYVIPFYILGIERNFILYSIYGDKKRIRNKEEFNLFVERVKFQAQIKEMHKRIELEINNSGLVFRFRSKYIRLFYDSKFQFLNSIQLIYCNFIREDNIWLDVKNKVVLDIGANVGDTAIYFVLKGAKKVFALEPYIYSCNIMKKNLRLNHLGNRVKVLRAGVGPKHKIINIDKRMKNQNSSRLLESEIGIKTKVYTLTELVNKLGLKNAALKMDCEGYEYDIIRETPDYVLKKFSDMIISCHNNNTDGVLEIKDKLSRIGFSIVDGLPDNSIGAFKK